jgi:hypothetical protein
MFKMFSAFYSLVIPMSAAAVPVRGIHEIDADTASKFFCLKRDCTVSFLSDFIIGILLRKIALSRVIFFPIIQRMFSTGL